MSDDDDARGLMLNLATVDPAFGGLLRRRN